MPKAKPNGFLNFMITWKRQQEKSGRSFPNGLKDVQVDPECNKAWQSCTPEEKNKYKNMKIPNGPSQNVCKKTTLGEDMEKLHRKKQKEEAFIDEMKEKISTLVNEAKLSNSIPELKFYVIHVNYFYSYKEPNDLTEIIFHPAEIAIVEFSLAKGVTRVYNQIVNKEIKMGYTLSAQEKSAGSHQIPLNFITGKSNYKELFKDIYDFIKPGSKNGKLPPIYTIFLREDIHYPVKSVLERLAVADGRAEDFFDIYSFEEIFSAIQNSTGDRQIEPAAATLSIVADPYAYKKGLACDYHTNLSSAEDFCSQSIVQRWIFVLFDHCCEAFDIELIPGAHKPIDKRRIRDDASDTSDFHSVNSSFSSMYISQSSRVKSTISMTGVSNEHRELVSQRSYNEEMRRRAEAKKKSLEIVDYSKNIKKLPEVYERPLRAPFSRSTTEFNNVDTTDTESIDLSESSFPSLGRGSSMRKQGEKKPGGYAGYTKQ